VLSIDFIKSSASFFPELLVVMRYQIHSGSEEADDFMKSTIECSPATVRAPLVIRRPAKVC